MTHIVAVIHLHWLHGTVLALREKEDAVWPNVTQQHILSPKAASAVCEVTFTLLVSYISSAMSNGA